MRRKATPILAVLALAAAGRGSSGPKTLSNDAQYQVAHADVAITGFCLHQAQGGNIPTSDSMLRPRASRH